MNFKTAIVGMLFLLGAGMTPLSVMSSGGSGGGTAGGGAGGGTAGGGSGGGRDSHVTDSRYEKGKKVFREKVVCSNCPLSDLELTRDNVAMILSELDSNGEVGEHLGFFERRSVKHYIRQRFNL